jgi:LmbE family N-acetylglucosaminyl deacetylase
MEAAYPGPQALGRTREAELRAAVQVLGMREVTFLDYEDGELDKADAAEVVAQLVLHIRRIRPDVVVTFDPDGVYGHPDHIAVSQLATAAIVAAADSSYADSGQAAHRVSKARYRIFTANRLLIKWPSAIWSWTSTEWNGAPLAGRPERSPRIDTSAYWPQVWEAIACHRSAARLPCAEKSAVKHHRQLWGQQTFYQAFSLVNGRRMVEVICSRDCADMVSQH